MANRNGVRIVGDFLQIADESGMSGANLTSLLRKANLSYVKLSSMASKLIQAGLIEEKVQQEQRERLFVITPRGREYLHKYQQFSEFANSFGLKL
jgi:predicted transcriptional regulator